MSEFSGVAGIPGIRGYPADTIALAGHADSQAPQSMQASGSILKGLPEVMAPCGHSSWQLPQLSHLSVIL